MGFLASVAAALASMADLFALSADMAAEFAEAAAGAAAAVAGAAAAASAAAVFEASAEEAAASAEEAAASADFSAGFEQAVTERAETATPAISTLRKRSVMGSSLLRGSALQKTNSPSDRKPVFGARNDLSRVRDRMQATLHGYVITFCARDATL